MQSFEASRKSGVVLVRSGMQEARIYVRHGNVVDAELGPLRGEEAMYRALIWDEATFDVEFKPVTNEDTIGCSTQALLMKCMRRVDEWVRLCAQVQPLAALLDVHPPQLLERLSALTEIPEAWKAMVRLPARTAARPELSPSAVVMREDMTTGARERAPQPSSPAPALAAIAPEPLPPSPEPLAVAAEVPDVAPEPPAVEASPAAFVPEPASPASIAAAPVAIPPPAAPQAVAPAPRSTANGVHGSPVPRAHTPAAQADVIAEAPAPHADRAAAAAPVAAPRIAEPPPRPTTPAKVPTPDAVSTARVETRATAAAAAESIERPAPAPARVPSVRPSAAPWTREVEGSAEGAVDTDAFAAGVPRAMSASAKRVSIAVGVVAFALFGGLWSNSVRAHQLREAEAARSKNVAVVGTAAFARATSPAPTATAPAPSAAAIPEAPPVVVAVAASASAAAGAVEDAPILPPNGGASPASAPAEPAAPAAPAAVAVLPAANAHETAIDVTTTMHSQSPFIRDAQRALLKGDTMHAAELAQKAVVKDPGDADAWLTLAAARKASGDLTGAAEAYSSCVAKAQTVSVTSCRALAKMHGAAEAPRERAPGASAAGQ